MEYTLEELMPLVTRLSERYTDKEHSSITYEAAEHLMNAVIYCINENERVVEEDSDSLLPNKTRNDSAADAYHTGYELVMKKAKRSNELYTSISKGFCSYENRAYSDTVMDGMPVFFRKYNPLFSPQDHLLTLDYPTILHLGEYCGIDAIYLYLRCIELEQIFLQAFPYDRILEVLKNYHNNYEELFINICDIILRNILSCIMAGKDDVLSPITELDYQRIGGLIHGHSDEELFERLKEMVILLVKEGYDGNPALTEYLMGALRDFICELRLLCQLNGRNDIVTG